MKLNDYRKMIKNATTKKELTEISYQAFLEDEMALTGKNSLYNRVITACVCREIELGI